MKISILTATYNRAGLLNNLYRSIKNNINPAYDIEWLIMDDGSKDKTEQVCKKFESENKIEIKYFKQKNQGKMKAINNLAMHVTGDLWVECDSDDYFVNNCFIDIITAYNGIKDKKNTYALAFLKEDQCGHNMGKKFTNDKTKMFDLYFKDGENGEKALVFITKVRKNYRYELEENESFVTESRMYHKMDMSYNIRCFNKTIMICEYQSEGYSKNIHKQFVENPMGYYKYFYEILTNMDTSKILISKRLYVIKHYILFTYLTKSRLNLKIKGLFNKLLTFILYIPGIIESKKFLNRGM